HLKIDTGMHRQGFQMRDLPRVLKYLAAHRAKADLSIRGIYTHFASATPPGRTYTEAQFGHFERACHMFDAAGFHDLVRHAAATGGALLDPRYHLDAVRIGKGLYGFFPSPDFEKLTWGELLPVLSW